MDPCVQNRTRPQLPTTGKLYRAFSCTPTISTSLSEEAMLIWPLRWEPSLCDSSTSTWPETNERTGVTCCEEEHSGRELQASPTHKDCSCFETERNNAKMKTWNHRMRLTLDKTQTVNLSRWKRSIILYWGRTESLKHQMWTRVVGEAVKGDHFPHAASFPASKCLHWEEWKWSVWVYRVCNWPEKELSALIHPEWAAKSWPLCVFSSCFITVGRTVSTLILSWLESVSEIS